MAQIKDYYKEASEQLFGFYTSLIEAGFTNEQSFELIRTSVSNSAIENMVIGYKEYVKHEKVRTALRGE